jgi:hyperosmotically inducible protein
MKTLPTQSKLIIATAVLTALFATGCERRDAAEGNAASGMSSTAPADSTATPGSAGTEMSPPAATPDSTTPPAASDTPPATPGPSADDTMSGMKADAKQGTEKAKTAIDDTIITTKVKTALLADSDIKGLAIDVETSGGVVTLTGAATNQTQIDRAGKLASDVKGVSAVDNKLTIKQ